MGAALYFAGNDISGATQSFDIHGGLATTIDVTDVTQLAFERRGGERSGEVNWVSLFDPTVVTGQHAILSPQAGTDQVVTALMPPVAIGCPALNQMGRQTNYDGTRAQAGDFTFALNDQSDGFGQEWGNSLTAGKRTDSVATAGSPFDNLAAFAFGAQAYLQVFAFSGTDVTVKVQHATTSGGAYSDLITFGQITTGQAPQSQRGSVSNVTSVNEFLKATTVTTGGFSNLVFQVSVVVNSIAGVVF
jgi:hypothetical protein